MRARRGGRARMTSVPKRALGDINEVDFLEGQIFLRLRIKRIKKRRNRFLRRELSLIAVMVF